MILFIRPKTIDCPQRPTQVMELGLGCVRYVDCKGDVASSYPDNPNGSAHSIASLCSPDGRHLAIMPHPGARSRKEKLLAIAELEAVDI